MQHYNMNRYYDQPAEPPPAHRPLTSHSTLSSMAGSDRPPLGHLGAVGTPDRPMGSHSAMDRHGIPLAAGLGAAGNLMGAVARHIGVEAPTSQRGIQAATPPHASQVPPQAESLLMLLKVGA